MSLIYVGDFAIRYTPNQGFCGYDSFSYTISDSTQATSTATVHIMVECGITNTRPIGIQDNVNTDRNTSIVVDILANDTDADQHPIEVITATPLDVNDTHGTVTVNANDTISYSPDNDFCGTDRYIVRIKDNYSLDDYGHLVVNVACTNRPPVTSPDSITIIHGGSAIITPLANDSDPDGDPISLKYIWPPQHGSAAISAPNEVTYNSKTGACSTDYVDQFSYDIEDDKGGYKHGVITVNLTCVNPPNVVNDLATVDEDAFVDINVLVNDDAGLSVVSVTTPSNGTTAINANNTVRYTPSPDYCGPDSFNYTAQNSSAVQSTTNVDVTVNCLAEIPVTATTLAWSPDTVTVGQPVTLSWAFNNAASCTNTHSSQTATSGSEQLTFFEVGTVIATMTCKDAKDISYNFSVPLTVNKLDPPTNLRSLTTQ